MDLILHIWNKIVSTNTFNFIVMAVLLYWIFKKVDIMKLLENSRQKVIDSIETSKAEKALAHKKLADANEQVKNLDKEVAEQLSLAEKQGDDLSKNILADKEKRITSIEENVGRAIHSEEKTISARLTRKTAQAAVLTAENHIKNVLKNSPQMHNRYIEESIAELDRIQL